MKPLGGAAGWWYLRYTASCKEAAAAAEEAEEEEEEEELDDHRWPSASVWSERWISLEPSVQSPSSPKFISLTLLSVAIFWRKKGKHMRHIRKAGDKVNAIQ